jgi:hypothetical protein
MVHPLGGFVRIFTDSLRRNCGQMGKNTVHGSMAIAAMFFGIVPSLACKPPCDARNKVSRSFGAGIIKRG